MQIRKEANKKIEKYKRKIKVLQQKERRHKQKITNLQDLLKSLKNKYCLQENELNVIGNIGKCNEDLFKRLLKKSLKKSIPKTYTPELRSFALTLHYYCPKAYTYVRKKLYNCLPHPVTISKWYQSVHAEPGFSKEALNCIKERVVQSNYPLLGALIIDEMSIRQHVEYDGKKCSGYIDMGGFNETHGDDDSLPVAKDALVFLINCINGAWKIPIAYFLINGITSDQKVNLIKNCLSFLHDIGMRITSLTFDGTSSNIKMAKDLGCNFNNLKTLQSWFRDPQTNNKIYVYLDPCHMIKLVRNSFGALKSLMNGSDETISWTFLEKLHEIQEKEGLHLANKLRTAHINYLKQKMKVRLATQTFSKSVADSLRICSHELNLKGFDNCTATIEFINIFNDLFDIFNSKNMKQYNFKKPINEKNKSEIFAKLTKCENYILNLKTANGQSILDCRKRTGFFGFLVCIASLKDMYKTLCVDDKLLLYMPMYKISQDHIELLFCSIRAHGGGNNNPTARQFKAAMKKILVHTELRDGKQGNCIPLEHISILHFSSNVYTSSTTIINNSACNATLNYDSAITNITNMHSYIPDFREITQFSNIIVSYIAGFVTKTLLNKLECENCINELIQLAPDRSKSTNYILIATKNRGGLVYPSENVVSICKVCEKIIKYALSESGGKILAKKYDEMFLISKVLYEFIGQNTIFKNLGDHIYDQCAMDNHYMHLIRAIAQNYIKIRMFHIFKQFNNPESNRHIYNKLVLFKGK